MTKVGLKKIGIVEINYVDDTWTEQNANTQTNTHIVFFNNIDQEASSIESELIKESSGQHYETRISITVRTKEDVANVQKYNGVPVVVYAYAVDGNTYTIGTKEYPTRMLVVSRYNGLLREAVVSVNYKSLFDLL